MTAVTFENPYVLGFLQPVVWLRALHRVVDRLASNGGRHLLPAMESFSDPVHPGSVNYLAGQKDGSRYTLALHAGDTAGADTIVAKLRRQVLTNTTRA